MTKKKSIVKFNFTFYKEGGLPVMKNSSAFFAEGKSDFHKSNCSDIEAFLHN